jgi:hypothetical protein
VTQGKSTTWFALRQPPAAELAIAGRAYRLTRVFKHDFFAATCLYSALEPQGDLDELVVKFYRTQRVGIVPMCWHGRHSRNHERAVYRRLAGIPGIPRYVADVGDSGQAIEFIHALPIDHGQSIPPGFFDRLRGLFDAVHASGVAYVDANKRSNILLDESGGCWLIDFQISIICPDWRWPAGAMARGLVRYFQGKDIYHLYKHKRRLAEAELTEDEREISYRRTGLHALHRWLTKPYRAIRRRFLGDKYRQGKLVSPTSQLEDHYQPEKETWRGKGGKSGTSDQ